MGDVFPLELSLLGCLALMALSACGHWAPYQWQRGLAHMVFSLSFVALVFTVSLIYSVLAAVGIFAVLAFCLLAYFTDLFGGIF